MCIYSYAFLIDTAFKTINVSLEHLETLSDDIIIPHEQIKILEKIGKGLQSHNKVFIHAYVFNR